MMMDYVNGWMHGSMGGGIGAVIGLLVVVLLVVVIINQSKKYWCVHHQPMALPDNHEMKNTLNFPRSQFRPTEET
jgi:hypothetical protein